MPEPPIHPLEESLDGRAFAFFPPIRNVAFNEWRFLKSTWSELLVANEKAGVEVWIPRRHFGAISSVDQPIPIVGLERELEYRAGSVFPYRSKLLEMPKEVLEKPSDESRATGSGAKVATAGSGPRNEGNVFKLIGVALAMALVLVFGAVAIYRGGGFFRQEALLSTSDQQYLGLGAEDDYTSIVRRLGKPSDDRRNSRSKEVVFRVLEYKERGYSVILFGADDGGTRYIGTMDANWRPLHSVAGHGTDYSAMLRALPRF
jgi:hypothetical protein